MTEGRTPKNFVPSKRGGTSPENMNDKGNGHLTQEIHRGFEREGVDKTNLQ